MSARWEASGAPARLGVAMVAVLAVILFLRPGPSEPGDPAGAPSPTPAGVLPTATPSTAPSDAVFCDRYLMLGAAQGQYLAHPDERGTELLRETADDLLATGVPASMRVPARTGYFVEISGVYATLGETLDRRAVPGAAEGDGGSSLSGTAGAFGAWLTRFCPAP